MFMAIGFDASRDLLLGLLALRRERISQAQLMAAFDSWTMSSPRALGEILIEQGALEESERQFLQNLAENHFGEARERPDLSQTVAYRGMTPVEGPEPS